MLRARLTDLFQISVPIVLAPVGPWDPDAPRGRGLHGRRARQPRDGDPAARTSCVAQWQWVREPDRRPVRGQPHRATVRRGRVRGHPAVRVRRRSASTWASRPTSSRRAHDSGIRWSQTVGDVARRRRQAVAAGADVLVAHGGEAGGNSGWISDPGPGPRGRRRRRRRARRRGRGASPTAGGSRPRSRSARPAPAWAPASSPPTRWSIDPAWATAGRRRAGTWEAVRARHLAPAALRVVPRVPFDVDAAARPARLVMPSLLRASLRIGAHVCGPPAHDAGLGTADLYVLLRRWSTSPRGCAGRPSAPDPHAHEAQDAGLPRRSRRPRRAGCPAPARPPSPAAAAAPAAAACARRCRRRAARPPSSERVNA